MSSATHVNPAKPVTDVYLLAGLGLLAVRIIQGFIYWGGGADVLFMRRINLTRMHPTGWPTSFRRQCPVLLWGWSM